MANELERSKRIIFDKKLEDEISEDNIRLLKKYKMDMQVRELSPQTIYNYERDIIQWFSFLGKNQFKLPAQEVAEEDVEEFIFFCKNEGNNTERIKRRLSSISAFYKFLRKKKIISENPLEFISRPKKGLPVVKQIYLTDDQIADIRKWLEEKNDTRMTAYFEFSLDTMARVGAVSSVKWEQIDFENYIIEDVLEKEQRLVTLYFGERTKEILLKLKKELEDNNINSPYLFSGKDGSQLSHNTLRDWSKKIGVAINEPELHPHSFRKTGATQRKNAGMSLEDISFFLNHLSTDVTKLYVKENTNKRAAMFRNIKI